MVALFHVLAKEDISLNDGRWCLQKFGGGSVVSLGGSLFKEGK